MHLPPQRAYSQLKSVTRPVHSKDVEGVRTIRGSLRAHHVVGNRADLYQHTQEVGAVPHLDDLAIDHSIHDCSGEPHLLACWSMLPEVAKMRSGYGQIGRHNVALGDEFVDLDFPVGKGGALAQQTLSCL